MSTSQLWAPQAQRPAQNIAAVANSQLPNRVPGTWLQLSPNASAPAESGNKFLSLSPTTSPSLKGEEGSATEDLTLPRATGDRYLTNHSSASRTSSVSSSSSTSRHPSLGQRSQFNPSIERREMSVGRVGGIGGAFLSNN